MTASMADRALALAGLLQALRLVQKIAQEGVQQGPELDASLASVFQLDADSTEAVFGSAARVRDGLDALVAQLQGGLAGEAGTNRLAVTVLHVERKLARRRDLLAKIREGVLEAARQREHFGVGHATVAARLADLYAATVSTLSPRVLVQGNPVQLARPETVAQIRAVLLAAMRAAVLWRQLGGSWFDLLLRRRALLEAARGWR